MGHIFLRQQKTLQIQVDKQHLFLFPNEALLTHFSENKKEEIYIIVQHIGDLENVKWGHNIHIFALEEQKESFTCGVFSINTLGGITIGIGSTTRIFYDIGNDVSAIPPGEYAIAFLDVEKGMNRLYDLASHIHPKIGVPISTETTPAYYIDICRELMQRQLCIPKYLQSNQYLLFEE